MLHKSKLESEFLANTFITPRQCTLRNSFVKRNLEKKWSNSQQLLSELIKNSQKGNRKCLNCIIYCGVIGTVIIQHGKMTNVERETE